MPKSRIDWVAVDNRLPLASDSRSREARSAIFKEMDTNRNGSLSMSEAQSAVSCLLRAKKDYRGRRANPAQLPIKDYKPCIKGAFNATSALEQAARGQGRRAEGSTVLDRTEFHAFIVAFRWYLELQVIFEDADTSGDKAINYRECAAAISSLEGWDITMEAIQAKFPSNRKAFDGGIKFPDFAEWAIRKRFGTMSFSLDVPQEEEDGEEEGGQEAAAEGDGAAAEPPAEPQGGQGQAEPSSPELASEGERLPAAAASEDDAPLVEDPSERVPVRTTTRCETSTESIAEWAARLKRTHQRFCVGDRVEAIYNPTGGWCSGAIAEVKSAEDGIYILDWDPAGDFVFRLDREKCGCELRPEPIPGEAETLMAASTRQPSNRLAPDQDDALQAFKKGFVPSDDDDAEIQEQIEQQFRSFDADNNGLISAEELSAVLKSLDSRFDDAAIRCIMTSADLNQDGSIDYAEFVKWCFA